MSEWPDDLGLNDLGAGMGADCAESRILVGAIQDLDSDRITDWIVISHVITKEENGDESLVNILTTNTDEKTAIHLLAGALHGIWEEM
jgi:hypothetical protein